MIHIGDFPLLLSVYLIAMFAIGLSDRKRAASGKAAFYLANRSLSSWRTFAGLGSTTTGGTTTLVLCAVVAAHGLSGMWYDFAGAMGLGILGFFLASRVRRCGSVTLPEIAGEMYGPSVRRVASLLVVSAQIVWFALLTEATQTVLTSVLGIGATRALVISAIVFIAYTCFGGQYSVIRTDVVQYSLMWIGLIGIAVPFAWIEAGGFSGLRSLPSSTWSFPSGPSFSGTEVVAIVLTLGLPHLVGSDIYGKLLSARDERAARAAAISAGIAKGLFGVGIGITGLAAVRLGTVHGSETLVRTILVAVPPGLSAFVLVALVATMQSSCDSVLLTAVATTTEDLLPEWFHRRKEDSVAGPRILAILIGGFGLLVALVIRDLLETLKIGYTLFSSGLALPILVGFGPERWRPKDSWARAAMLAGGGVAMSARLARTPLRQWFLERGVPAPVADSSPILAGLGVCALVLVMGSGMRILHRDERITV